MLPICLPDCVCKYLYDSQFAIPFFLVGNKLLPREYVTGLRYNPPVLQIWFLLLKLCRGSRLDSILNTIPQGSLVSFKLDDEGRPFLLDLLYYCFLE